jgi:hypothetical protein
MTVPTLRVRPASARRGRFFDADQCSLNHRDRVIGSPAGEEIVDSRLLLESADFSRGQAAVRLFRKPVLRRRLRRLTSLTVIVLVSIGLWVVAIWTTFAILGGGA